MMLPQSKVLGFVANGFHGIVDGSDVVGLVADKGALAQGQKDVGFGKDVQRQIELPRRLFRHKLHYLIFLPSR